MTAEAPSRKRPPLKGRDTLTSQLRDIITRAIEREHTTAYAVARLADIDPKVLSRFLAGESGLTMTTADRIGGVLNLRIGEAISGVTRKKPKARNLS